MHTASQTAKKLAEVLSVTSGFAVVDVKRGRVGLRKALGAYRRTEVTLTGVIDGTHSKDDGASQEFSIVVTSIVVTAA